MTTRRAFVATPAVMLGTDATVSAMFGYDAAAPWSVTIAFRCSCCGWVEWVLARELLAAGLVMPAGAGDITVAPFPGAVLVELRTGSERAEFLFDGFDVARILAYSYELVPLGAERLDWAAEEWLVARDEAL